jgi:hypothetical protein
MGVGDKVDVGVNVGGSGVNVLVGVASPVMGMNGCAVCVKAAATVCATVVLMRFESGVEIIVTLGVVQASAAIIRTATAQRTGVIFNMCACFRSITNIIIPKPRHGSLL